MGGDGGRTDTDNDKRAVQTRVQQPKRNQGWQDGKPSCVLEAHTQIQAKEAQGSGGGGGEGGGGGRRWRAGTGRTGGRASFGRGGSGDAGGGSRPGQSSAYATRELSGAWATT